MTAIIVAAVIVVVVGGVLLIVVTRYVARRELAPLTVLVSGEVPPAPDWMQAALRQRPATPTDSWRWSTVETGGVLRGYRGDVRVPSHDVVLTASLQPHTHAATFSRAHPLRVSVDLPEFTQRTGLQRLVFGHYPDQTSLALRTDLQRAIRDQARTAGMSAKAAGRLKATTVAALAALVLLLVLAGVLWNQSEDLRNPPAPPRPQPTAPPASATKCPVSKTASTTPKRAASGNKDTGCALAEATRQAYVKRAPKGKPVTLAKVTRPKTKQNYDLACKGTTLVTCTSGKIVVYLY